MSLQAIPWIKHFFYLVLTAAVLFFSCAPQDTDFFDFTEPYILNISPSDDQTGVDPFTTIEITFSENVKKESAEDAFSLTASGETRGYFEWAGSSKMRYIPTYGWTIGEQYTIVMERTVLDLNRNRMQDKKISTFRIGTDFNNPYVLNTTQYQNPYIQINDVVITIYFSKPMNITSLQKAVSFSPTFDYRMELNALPIDIYPALTVLTIYSKVDLASMEEYQLTISEEASSLTGLPILRDYLYEFAMYLDTIRPVILKIESGIVTVDNPVSYLTTNTLLPEAQNPVNDILKKDALIVTFSEAMDRKTAEQAFNLKPTLQGCFYWLSDASSDIMIFQPETGLEQNTRYTLYLEQTLKDTAGNTMDKRSDNYIIRSLNQPINIHQIIFNEDLSADNPVLSVPDYQALVNFNEIVDNIKIRVLDLGINFNGKLNISVLFNDNSTDIEDLDFTSLYSNITVKHVMGEAESDPTIIGFHINEMENKIIIELTDLECNEYDPEYIKNLYELDITGGSSGIKDIYGNYMQDNIQILFKVTGRIVL